MRTGNAWRVCPLSTLLWLLSLLSTSNCCCSYRNPKYSFLYTQFYVFFCTDLKYHAVSMSSLNSLLRKSFSVCWNHTHQLLPAFIHTHTRTVYLVKNSWAANHLQNIAWLYCSNLFSFWCDAVLMLFFLDGLARVFMRACACALFSPRMCVCVYVFIYLPYGSIITLAFSSTIFKMFGI